MEDIFSNIKLDTTGNLSNEDWLLEHGLSEKCRYSELMNFSINFMKPMLKTAKSERSPELFENPKLQSQNAFDDFYKKFIKGLAQLQVMADKGFLDKEEGTSLYNEVFISCLIKGLNTVIFASHNVVERLDAYDELKEMTNEAINTITEKIHNYEKVAHRVSGGKEKSKKLYGDMRELAIKIYEEELKINPQTSIMSATRVAEDRIMNMVWEHSLTEGNAFNTIYKWLREYVKSSK